MQCREGGGGADGDSQFPESQIPESSKHGDMVQGLNEFKGGVLMVSHDQFMIESTVNSLWIVDKGAATPYHGSFQSYKSKLRAAAQAK